MLTTTSLPRGRVFLLAWIVVFAISGCSDETGLLIEVTRDEQTTAEIDELRFFIGSAVSGTTFVEDETPLRLVDLGGPRDLLADPYKLLLRPGDAIGGSDDPDTQREPRVMVAVIGRAGGQDVGFGTLDEPKLFHDGEVLQWTITLRGGGGYEVTPTDCLVFEQGRISANDDADCDGDLAPADCDDNDPTIGPSATEICENGIDDNCNGDTDEEVDGDGDGFTNCEECDDGNEAVNPNAQETCDGIDNDCDGTCDAEFDVDGDLHTTCGSKLIEEGASCLAPQETQADCNDDNELVFPGADELCDGFDNDCNDVCDDEWDPDGDKFTECGSRVDVCDGTSGSDVDCAPENEAINPAAPERCNGVDDNCDGHGFDASSPCYATGIAEGGEEVCVVGTRACDDSEGGAGWGDCDIEGLVDNPEFQAPASLCTAYDACEAAEAPDPFACANEMAADATVTCTVEVADPAGPDLCPRTDVAVPRADATGCFWQIVGGRIQRHWEVGLSFFESADTPPTGSGSAAVDACSIWFQVVRARDAPPVRDSVMLTAGDNTSGDLLIQVLLNPDAALICPDGPGIVCDTFPSPGG